MQIDWNSADSSLLLNPAYSPEEQTHYQQILEEASCWPGHIWLATSGSVAVKWVGLSKEALLASAHAVNQHLQSTCLDRWILALPTFHVGGLGVWARSYLTGAAVFDFRSCCAKWKAQAFYDFMAASQGTLTSLVPAQLYDLIQLGLKPPSSLRAVIIGGGVLLPELYQKGVELGWPLLPSYGLTECASQVAAAALGCWEKGEYPPLQILPHMQVRQSDERLAFKGPSLLSLYACFEAGHVRFYDPKQAGWLIGEDRGRIEAGHLCVLGRRDALIKIGGESVDLARLESHLQTICLQLKVEQEMTLVAMPDSRLGSVIHLATTTSRTSPLLMQVLEQFCQTVMPFEKIRFVHRIPFIPRSPLAKVLKKELLELIKLAHE